MLRWHKLPTLFFYTPSFLYMLYLSAKHFTTPAIIMSANPEFEYGGLPFSSKLKMQSGFDKFLPYDSLLLDESLKEKTDKLVKFIEIHGLPIIIKPDTGHRGLGVVKCDDLDEAVKHIEAQGWDLMVQKYSGAPLEFGIFYRRSPSEKKGSVISLTKKVIPEGSGLVTASHCRGAEFFDYCDQVTPKLDQTVQQICDNKAFYFGRFDVKADSDEALLKGEFDIIEVNGATSEFIHIYDDKHTWKFGFSELFRQWRLLFSTAIAAKKKHNVKYSFIDFCKLYLRLFRASKKAEGTIW